MEHGAVVTQELKSNEKWPDYIIVDDRVHLDTIVSALEKAFASSKLLLDMLQMASVMRAKWLSSCLQRKELVDEGDSKLNAILEVYDHKI